MFFINLSYAKEVLLRIIIGFLFVAFFWCQSVLAEDCPAGGYLNNSVCTVCPEGTYSTMVNATGCKSCATNTNNVYKHTESTGATELKHCAAKVTFHGNGGKLNGEENVVLYAHYTNSDIGNYACYIQAGSTAHVCGSTKTEYWILDGTLLEPTLWERDGYAFIGWYSDNEIFNKKVNESGVFLTDDTEVYAKWLECKSSYNLVPKADKCICAQGYYGNATDGCTKCPDGKTTASAGATSETECKQAFGYGDSGEFWMWPDNVEIVQPSE